MQTILTLLRSVVLPGLRNRASLQIELIALRHQLAVLERKRTTRPRLTRIDRFLWVWFYRLWPGCLGVVVIVNPETRYKSDRLIRRDNSSKYNLVLAAFADKVPTPEGAPLPARADMVFFETPGGGAVFSTGSIAWCGSFAHNGYDNNVAKITGNVLRRFIEPALFAMPA